MPSPPTLDFEVLLNPIPGENPAGESLRYAGPYDAIKEARRADDDLDQGVWIREIKFADWSAVIEIATEALATSSKDLQIAVWLVEALVKRYGFPGLRDGLRLLWMLQEHFWNSLYPEIEEDDLEFRAAPLEWLNANLPFTIRQLPVTLGISGENYAWLHWQESRVVDNLGRRDEGAMGAALADGKIRGEQFDRAVETTPLAYYHTLFEELNQGREEYDKLDRLIDTLFGQQAPGLVGIKTALEDCHTLIEDILKSRGGLEPELLSPEPKSISGTKDPTPAEPEHTSVHSALLQPPPSLSLDPRDRADALSRLEALAAYFRRTEPHSPVSYLVQCAVRWSEMSLEDWLQFVINDEIILENIHETMGLKDLDSSGEKEDGT